MSHRRVGSALLVGLVVGTTGCDVGPRRDLPSESRVVTFSGSEVAFPAREPMSRPEDCLHVGVGFAVTVDATGDRLWRTRVPEPSGAAPFAVDGLVSLPNAESSLAALDARPGRPAWLAYIPGGVHGIV